MSNIQEEKKMEESVSTQLNNVLLNQMLSDKNDLSLAQTALKDPQKVQDQINSLLVKLGQNPDNETVTLHSETPSEDSSDGERQESNVSSVQEEDNKEEASVKSESSIETIDHVKAPPGHTTWTERVAKFSTKPVEVEVKPNLFESAPKHTEQKENVKPNQEEWFYEDVDDENNDPRKRKIKTDLLRRLQRLMGGPCYVKEAGLSMQTPLVELQYFEKTKLEDNSEDCAIMSAMDWTKIVLSAIENGNRRFGPFLQLDGWAKHLSQELNRFDRPYRQLYRRYFSQRPNSPISEIAWILIGSALMFHFTGRVSGKNDQRDVPSRFESGASVVENMVNAEYDEMPPPKQRRSDMSSNIDSIMQSGGLNIGSLMSMFN